MKNNKSSFSCNLPSQKTFEKLCIKRNKMDQQMKEDADVRRVPNKALNK